MSVDRFAILRSNPHPIKAFSGEGRSCVIDAASLHELIDRALPARGLQGVLTAERKNSRGARDR
jgi:hypothetical protein